MQFEHVTCPHCGILCDDLSVEVSETTITPLSVNHALCKKAYEQASIPSDKLPTPQIDGKNTSLENAIKEAASILKNASQPLISGLIADVQTCREALALAEKAGGVIDHANGPHMRANVAVLQRIGKVKTTLAEARNRSDNIIIFGAKVLDSFPRLLERVLMPNKTLGVENTINKRITIIDSNDQPDHGAFEHDNINYMRIDAPSLESIIEALELTVHTTDEFAEHNPIVKALLPVHQQILDSQYTTLIWSTGLFERAYAEQTVQTITQSIKTLMKEVRCVGLPLGGSKAEITASQVATWQTGVPLPVSFMTGIPVHDPLLYNGAAMLENNEADALIWISTYSSDDVPPDTKIARVVLGHPGMQIPSNTSVFIPVGIPGIDTRGLACRADSVATLPLHKLRDNGLPNACDVLNKMIEML